MYVQFLQFELTVTPFHSFFPSDLTLISYNASFTFPKFPLTSFSTTHSAYHPFLFLFYFFNSTDDFLPTIPFSLFYKSTFKISISCRNSNLLISNLLPMFFNTISLYLCQPLYQHQASLKYINTAIHTPFTVTKLFGGISNFDNQCHDTFFL